EPAAWKIHVLDRFAGVVKELFERERDDFERRRDPLVVFDRKGGQQAIRIVDRRGTVLRGYGTLDHRTSPSTRSRDRVQRLSRSSSASFKQRQALACGRALGLPHIRSV